MKVSDTIISLIFIDSNSKFNKLIFIQNKISIIHLFFIADWLNGQNFQNIIQPLICARHF